MNSTSYFYQYESYLNNLMYSKIYQICVYVSFFLVFMVLITQYIEELNPAIVAWNPNIFELALWKIPPIFKDRITINKAKYDAYMGMTFTFE